MTNDIIPGAEPENDIPFIPANPEPAQLPVPMPAGKRNQHLKKDEPKDQQFTGRATKTEAERIKKALETRKQEGQTYDCIRLLLDCLNHIEADIFQTFKTR